MGTLELHADHWNVVIAPSLGGSLLVCEYDDMRVLQPTAQPQHAGLQRPHCCYFPLIPYSNRIEDGRFRFRGRKIRLAGDVAGSPHAIHGHGWQVPWQVVGHGDTACELSFRHAPASDWPWPYVGRQTVAIAGNELQITLSIENLGSSEMPCGLGFHPFLPADGAHLQLAALRVWDGPAGAFPSRRVAVPAELGFESAARVAGRQGTDHCFDGWRGRATVSYEEGARTLVLEGCAATHSVIVYIPAAADYFCVEPVTHMVNAMNLPDTAEGGLWTLGPQETRQISMSVRCQPTARDSPLPRPHTNDRNP